MNSRQNIILSNYHESGVIDDLHKSIAFVIYSSYTDGITTRVKIESEYLKGEGNYVAVVNQATISMGPVKNYPAVINLKFDNGYLTWQYHNGILNKSWLIPRVTLFKVINNESIY